MTDFPKVTVVVPVRNAASTIDDCFESLRALNYPRDCLEIIVVNNGSTDETQTLLEKFQLSITVLHEEKKGPAAARNKGIRNANGEIVVFTDADCTVEPDWLQNLVLLLKDETVGVVGGKILSKRPCNRIEKFGEQIHNHNQAINICTPPYVITMNWASRRSTLEELGMFDERFLRSEDVELSRRILQAGYKFAYAEQATIYHRNEKTFFGLVAEGFTHGFHSIKFFKVHRVFMERSGHRRIFLRSYLNVAISLMKAVIGPDRHKSLCEFLFNVAKKCGKVAGSVRFRHLDL